jgi:hypothetical protein
MMDREKGLIEKVSVGMNQEAVSTNFSCTLLVVRLVYFDS